jgi:hypothetical protein
LRQGAAKFLQANLASFRPVGVACQEIINVNFRVVFLWPNQLRSIGAIKECQILPLLALPQGFRGIVIRVR